jgi:hypothetical protein
VTTLLTTLSRLFARFGLSNPEPQRATLLPAPRKTLLEVEELPSRVLPAARVVGDTLFVDGTASNDKITVREQGLSIVVSNARSGLQGFDAWKINEIVVRGRGGDDRLMLPDTRFMMRRRVTLDGGAGNDVITVGDLARDVRIAGRGGDDRITVGSHASGLQISGDAGDDHITVGVQLMWSGIDGGRGGDSIAVGDAAANVLIDGNMGADDIVLGMGTWNVEVNGGAHHDTIFIGGSGLDAIVVESPGQDEVEWGSGFGN